MEWKGLAGHGAIIRAGAERRRACLLRRKRGRHTDLDSRCVPLWQCPNYTDGASARPRGLVVLLVIWLVVSDRRRRRTLLRRFRSEWGRVSTQERNLAAVALYHRTMPAGTNWTSGRRVTSTSMRCSRNSTARRPGSPRIRPSGTGFSSPSPGYGDTRVTCGGSPNLA